MEIRKTVDGVHRPLSMSTLLSLHFLDSSRQYVFFYYKCSTGEEHINISDTDH